MQTEKEQIQNQIQELQEKLKKLEEQEPKMLLLRQGKVDIVDYKKKTYLRIEYTDSFSGVYKWYKREITFGDGLSWTLILDHSQFYYLLEKFYQEEVVKQKDDYPYKKYTPEETEQSLKSAFREAVKQGVVSSVDKPTYEEDNDKDFKNSLDLIKEWGEKNKTPTLKELLREWWDEVFVNQMDDDICIDVLVSKIDKEFIPPNSNTNDYQWNKCLELMRNKLR